MKVASRRSLVAVLAALAASVLCLPANAGATHLTETGSPTGPSIPWGFNEDWGWDNSGWSSTLTTRHLQLAGAIEEPGLAANRFHVQWAKVESRRGRYNWTETDAQYAAMQRYGAEPVMLLFNAPAWARDPAAPCPASTCAYPPVSKYDGDWKKFVRAAIVRYRNVRAIEIWNEANLGRFWAPAPDPRRYGQLLKLAHDAAVEARSPKPVIVGGLAPAANSTTTTGAAEYLKQLYASTCSCYWEGIGTHPYTTQVPLVDNVAKRLDKVRVVRDANGDSQVPLWITEIGLSSNGTSGVTLETQGDELVRLYRSVEGHDVASFVIHRFHDVDYDGDYWNQTGVVGVDLTPKPAYCRLGAAIGTPC